MNAPRFNVGSSWRERVAKARTDAELSTLFCDVLRDLERPTQARCGHVVPRKLARDWCPSCLVSIRADMRRANLWWLQRFVDRGER